MTQRPDWEWRAVSNEKFFENKMFIGQLYRNELAANLKELGYGIQSDEKGLFEIKGIPQELRDEFSRRSEQIEKAMKDLKEEYPNASNQVLREMACLGSREAKHDVNMEQVRNSWDERMAGLGYTRAQLVEQSISREPAQEKPSHGPGVYITMATRAITEQESAFSREQVLRIAGKFSVGEYRLSQLEKVMEKNTSIVKLAENVYTTKEMQKI